NIRNQLAQGLVETGRFADAEKILAGLDNNPAVLPELAVCIFLEGDQTRANTTFEKFLSLRPQSDPVTPLFRAAWLALTGHVRDAIRVIESFHDAQIGLIQMSIWQLMSGDVMEAKKNAALAAGKRGSFRTVALLLARGDEPVEKWRDDVNSSGLSAQEKLALLGYGFFLYGHYPEAAQIWQTALQASGGA